MIVYTSPTCGKCKQLKTLLNEKNIDFIESEDVKFVATQTDIKSLPIVELEGRYIDFIEALKWALKQEA